MGKYSRLLLCMLGLALSLGTHAARAAEAGVTGEKFTK